MAKKRSQFKETKLELKERLCWKGRLGDVRREIERLEQQMKGWSPRRRRNFLWRELWKSYCKAPNGI